MRKLRIALTKGRLEKQTVALFEKMGLDCTELHNKGRRLILPVGDYEAVLAKAADAHHDLHLILDVARKVGQENASDRDFQILCQGEQRMAFALCCLLRVERPVRDG